MKALLATAALAAALAAGASAPAADWKRCANATLGYDLTYPAGWRTAGATKAQACRYFDPKPFAVDKVGPLRAVAVAIEFPSEQTFAELASQEPGDATIRVKQTALRIAGRRALRIELTPTAGPDRARLYAVAIEHRGRPLLFETREEKGRDYAATKALVNRMAASLRFRS